MSGKSGPNAYTHWLAIPPNITTYECSVWTGGRTCARAYIGRGRQTATVGATRSYGGSTNDHQQARRLHMDDAVLQMVDTTGCFGIGFLSPRRVASRGLLLHCACVPRMFIGCASQIVKQEPLYRSTCGVLTSHRVTQASAHTQQTQPQQPLNPLSYAHANSKLRVAR